MTRIGPHLQRLVHTGYLVKAIYRTSPLRVNGRLASGPARSRDDPPPPPGRGRRLGVILSQSGEGRSTVAVWPAREAGPHADSAAQDR